MVIEESLLTKLRQEYCLPLPELLKNPLGLRFEKGTTTTSIADEDALQKQFSHTYGQPIVHAKKSERQGAQSLKVGVVFSGGQAAGGHNVIAGLFDTLKKLHPHSQLIGFLGGPNGIIKGIHKELTEEILAPFRNQGGFDLMGSGRTKIETKEQLQSALQVIQFLALDGLVIVGGDDSNTNAAILAEYFLEHGCKTKVIGVPKTIDGDLRNDYVEIPFGFDTACKTYSEMIGNIARDALSAKKYYHFIKLMGRSASHIALECAFATQPNYTFIGEEVAAKQLTLSQIAHILVDLIDERKKAGKTYGIVLIPEGLIEFIPEIGILIKELNALGQMNEVRTQLSKASLSCFDALPKEIQQQLLMDRDPHGNVRVSQIETERLLIAMVKEIYQGEFSAIGHFCGYEGRAALPSNFDSHYGYALGATAAVLTNAGLTGYMCSVQRLAQPVEKWEISGIPLTMLMHLELRKGTSKPVIQKALVDLNGPSFRSFSGERDSWRIEDHYRFPGPIQFFGPKALTDTPPTLLTKDLL